MVNKVQLLVTNVRGPSSTIFLDKIKVKSFQFWPPAKGELTGGVAMLSLGPDLLITTIFDECELITLFDDKAEWEQLTKADRAILSQYLASLIRKEFDSLARHTDQLLKKTGSPKCHAWTK